jgi:hypothetical protein
VFVDPVDCRHLAERAGNEVRLSLRMMDGDAYRAVEPRAP